MKDENFRLHPSYFEHWIETISCIVQMARVRRHRLADSAWLPHRAICRESWRHADTRGNAHSAASDIYTGSPNFVAHATTAADTQTGGADARARAAPGSHTYSNAGEIAYTRAATPNPRSLRWLLLQASDQGLRHRAKYANSRNSL